jgi:hypothetical protein
MERKKEVLLSIASGARHYRLTLLGDAELEIERGWYCPNFGDRQSIHVVSGRRQGAAPGWLGWILQPPETTCAVDACFSGELFQIRLPNEHVVALPLRP